MRWIKAFYQKRTCEKHHPQEQGGSAYQLRGVQPAGFRLRLIGVADRVTQRLDHELSVYLHGRTVVREGMCACFFQATTHNAYVTPLLTHDKDECASGHGTRVLEHKSSNRRSGAYASAGSD